MVIPDFEVAEMSAVKQVLSDSVDVHGCFYHLTQSTWRKIRPWVWRQLQRGQTASSLRRKFEMMDELAFLPVTGVSSGLHWLTSVAPPSVLNSSATSLRHTSTEYRVKSDSGYVTPCRASHRRCGMCTSQLLSEQHQLHNG